MRTRFLFAGLVFSLLVFPAFPQAAAPVPPRPSKPVSAKLWDPLVGEGVRAGLGRGRLQATAERLARAGLTPQAGRTVLEPAFDAAKQGLPWESVLAKLDEGMIKRATPEVLAAAGRARAASLARGRKLVLAARGMPSSREGRALVAATALALESGVADGVLEGVLTRGSGRPAAQLRPILEAGEALQLAGFEPEAVEALMGDCLAKKLRRQEVLRVVRYAVEKKRGGMSGMEIRQSLWAAAAPGKHVPGGETGPASTSSGGQLPKPVN